MSEDRWLHFELDGPPLEGHASVTRSTGGGGPVEVRTDGEYAYARLPLVGGVTMPDLHVLLLNGPSLGRWGVHLLRLGPVSVYGQGAVVVEGGAERVLDDMLAGALGQLGLERLEERLG